MSTEVIFGGISKSHVEHAPRAERAPQPVKTVKRQKKTFTVKFRVLFIKSTFIYNGFVSFFSIFLLKSLLGGPLRSSHSTYATQGTTIVEDLTVRKVEKPTLPPVDPEGSGWIKFRK